MKILALFEKIISLTIKDVKGWLRIPFLVIISVVPLLILATFIGVLVSQAESMPAGVIIEDSDPLALEIKDYMMTMTSGTGLKWFNIEDMPTSEVLDSFEKGQLLCYVVIPENISARIQTGEIVKLKVTINNINDDIAKNVLQRLQNVCNHFNQRLDYGGITFYTPEVIFETLTPVDVTFTFYISAAALALTVLLSSGVNVVTTTAKEFEDETIKELIMAASPLAIIAGKILTGIIQTVISFSIVLFWVFLLYGFVPAGNFLLLLLLILWGTLVFSSLGFLAASKIKSVVPAAVSLIVVHIAGWWVGGGLVPPEIWPDMMKILAFLWPGTYFIRSVVNLILLNNTSTLILDLVITGVFGTFVFLLAIRIFIKEVQTK
ncbi:MAG: ABC transporter permease [Candidatus Hermodarchaeota archaeon]